ncbi:MAG TPA: PspC domain-containing protein [Candidatus Paceibacterota bacterium]|nr:PspC domain-containing protein [Candidatus Paceibacterota bacterium]
MEKTTTVILAETRFEMTLEAFRLLETYIESLKTHFAADPDKEEIIRDIEGRIAEKFSENKAVIGAGVATEVIRQMGAPEDISSEETVAPIAAASRKLYRDPSAAILAGVAAGIAKYLGIDPLIIRLAFVLSIFFGGFGILLYVILWLLIPEALTASQKLEMRGSAVTLGTVAGFIREKGDEISRNGLFRRILYFPFEVAASLLRGLLALAPWMRKFLGIALCAVSFFAILAATAAAAFALSNLGSSSIELPLRDATSVGLLSFLIIAYYVAAAIPFVFIFGWGQRLMRAGHRVSSAVGFGLVGLWSLAVIIAVSLSFRAAIQYNEYLETAPAYQQVTEQIEGEFSSLRAIGDVEIELSNGPRREVSVSGYRHDLERAKYSVADGVLTVESRPLSAKCVFCDSDDLRVAIAMPSLASIEVQGGSLRFDDFKTDALEIKGEHARISGALEAENLLVQGSSLLVDLIGSAANATLNLTNSRFLGSAFEIKDATMGLHRHSFAEVWVLNPQEVATDDSSNIVYRATSTDEVSREIVPANE